MRVRRKIRAEQFLDCCREPDVKKGVHENMAESADSSRLVSRLNQVSEKSKMIPVSAEHLIVLADGLMDVLDNKVLSAIEEIKKLLQHKR